MKIQTTLALVVSETAPNALTESDEENAIWGHDSSDETTGKKKRIQGGVATSNVVMSAYVSGNADVFPEILKLHVPEGAKIADVTFGSGVFWKKIDLSNYDFSPSDIATGIDCRKLPYADESYDAIVLDPPYMEGLLRNNKTHKAGDGSHSAFREYYSNGDEVNHDGPKWHASVTDLYYRAGVEGYRVIKEKGVMIVKCQDANLQWPPKAKQFTASRSNSPLNNNVVLSCVLSGKFTILLSLPSTCAFPSHLPPPRFLHIAV